MTMVEGDARVTIEFQLQTRRYDDIVKKTYMPWIVAWTSDEDDVMMERERYIKNGFSDDRLRVIRVTTIEEVWKL